MKMTNLNAMCKKYKYYHWVGNFSRNNDAMIIGIIVDEDKIRKSNVDIAKSVVVNMKVGKGGIISSSADTRTLKSIVGIKYIVNEAKNIGKMFDSDVIGISLKASNYFSRKYYLNSVIYKLR